MEAPNGLAIAISPGPPPSPNYMVHFIHAVHPVTYDVYFYNDGVYQSYKDGAKLETIPLINVPNSVKANIARQLVIRLNDNPEVIDSNTVSN